MLGWVLFLGACAGVERRGVPRVYGQTLDSETSACARFPAQCPGAAGREAEALAARQRVAEAGAMLGSAAAAFYLEDKAQQARVEEAILDCVKDADYQLNERYFGGSPTREQCAEVVGRNARGEPVTRAMQLGREKHQLALECIQKKLQELRPGGFSLEQRYRLNEGSGKWVPLSRSQVEALLRAGGKGLVGTIEPDIVIHTGNAAEVLDVLDLKFPCPGTNPPKWNEYGNGHPYENLTQGQAYERAFGVKPARVAPHWDIQRPKK
ncbi:hypothetical protein DB31_7936 [Hyalangium minutum]|uniref:Uncharacterized protein n=1 Tax=Hyalangium minutum TaxID=394096 RepID=A0A085WLY6_9BACT|nr:hypothetical protein DB31_7936 [Hyalangium minutum]